MSNTRYIEIDSQYRDRSLWPNPAAFEILLSQSGTKDRFAALDPVSDSAVQLQQPVTFNAAVPAVVIAGTITILVAPSITQTTDIAQIVVTTAVGVAQRAENFYAGTVVEAATAPVQRRRIQASVFLSTSIAGDLILLTLTNNFTDAVVTGTAVTISSTSDPLTLVNPTVFIPTGEASTNFYINSIIELIDPANFAVISSSVIVFYNGALRLAQLSAPFVRYALNDTIIIRKQKASELGALLAGSTTTSINLPLTSSNVTNFYTGGFVRIRGPAQGAVVGPVPPQNENRRIVSYNATTKVAAVNPGFTVAPGAVAYEILPFTRDNAVPLTYTGSLVSQQEMVCYEIQLLNLILPNRLLESGRGSVITFYPYVYVEFSNISGTSAGNTNIIYSNNPNSTRALFRAPITDVPNLTASTFIKIDGDGMVQTVKFKPNDNFKFSVTLPSGEVFDTVLDEYLSPQSPNPLSQISAMFAVRRV